MPLTPEDVQDIWIKPIIVEARWGGSAPVAEVIAGTRSRAEDTYLMVSALTAAVSVLGASAGLSPTQISQNVAAAVDAKLADDFAALRAAFSGQLGAITHDQLALIARAVADENDRRERVRLGL